MTQQDQRQVIEAAKQADWQQVVLNGGPPCFHLESEGKFCLRAERWQGHGGDDYPFHRFVSLPMLLTTLRSTPPPTPQEPPVETERWNWPPVNLDEAKRNHATDIYARMPVEQRKMRSLLFSAWAIGNPAAYFDDGEMQFNAHSYIDFLRDSPEQITERMLEHGMARLTAEQAEGETEAALPKEPPKFKREKPTHREHVEAIVRLLTTMREHYASGASEEEAHDAETLRQAIDLLSTAPVLPAPVPWTQTDMRRFVREALLEHTTLGHLAIGLAAEAVSLAYARTLRPAPGVKS